jgi:sugar phosphate permease
VAAAPDKHIGFFEAFMLPNVLSYALAFGFFKLVNYAMFFQLPVILSAHFSPSAANIISALYSVGMMPGGIVCGWVSDLYGGRRACVIATFMGILCPLLLVFAQAMDSLHIVVLLVLLAFMGCLVGGPNNIITSAVAADLADDPSIKGSKSALGTVTGIINGSGSVTAALGQLAIPVLYSMGLVDGVGYRYVWYFLICCTIAGTLLLSGKVYKELYPRPESLLSHAAHAQSKGGYSAISGEEEGVTMVKV